jgi:hypothetical protein
LFLMITCIADFKNLRWYWRNAALRNFYSNTSFDYCKHQRRYPLLKNWWWLCGNEYKWKINGFGEPTGNMPSHDKDFYPNYFLNNKKASSKTRLFKTTILYRMKCSC